VARALVGFSLLLLGFSLSPIINLSGLVAVAEGATPSAGTPKIRILMMKVSGVYEKRTFIRDIDSFYNIPRKLMAERWRKISFIENFVYRGVGKRNSIRES
jgi:hypothetical protein